VVARQSLRRSSLAIDPGIALARKRVGRVKSEVVATIASLSMHASQLVLHRVADVLRTILFIPDRFQAVTAQFPLLPADV